MWFVSAFLIIAFLSSSVPYLLPPQHGSCPFGPPNRIIKPGCQWTVALDGRGCRAYAEECNQPPRCSRPNEIFWQCSSQCEPVCGGHKHLSCDRGCGPPKCQCAFGFLRNFLGQCVPENHCGHHQFEPQCGHNEEYVSCSSPCEPSCQVPFPSCPRQQCGPPKCQCRHGFVRFRGVCVIQARCHEFDQVDCHESGVCPFGLQCVHGFCKRHPPIFHRPCSHDLACPPEFVCHKQVCEKRIVTQVTHCKSHVECPNEAPFCSATGCIVHQCNEVQQCPPEFSCWQGFCKRSGCSNPGSNCGHFGNPEYGK